MQRSRTCRRGRSTPLGSLISYRQRRTGQTSRNAQHIDLLRAQLAFASSRGTEATTLLLAAAQRLEPLDLNLARETYLDAFSAALFGARLNGTIGVPEIAQAACAMPRRSEHEPTTADLLLDGLIALTDDYDIGVCTLPRRVAETIRRAQLPQGEAALVVAGLRRRSGVVGRRQRVPLVAPQRTDRSEDGHAQRTSARAQRAHAGARFLR